MPCCLISLSISCPVVTSHTSYPVVSLSHALLSHLTEYLMPCCLITYFMPCCLIISHPVVSSHCTSHALLSHLIACLMPCCLTSSHISCPVVLSHYVPHALLSHESHHIFHTLFFLVLSILVLSHLFLFWSHLSALYTYLMPCLFLPYLMCFLKGVG